MSVQLFIKDLLMLWALHKCELVLEERLLNAKNIGMFLDQKKISSTYMYLYNDT